MASTPTTVYLFAGDSLTEGVYGESYVDRVARALAQGWAGLGGQAVNAGRGGDTVGSLLGRIDAPLRDVQPHWVILAVGANDVWQPWLSHHSLGWWLWFHLQRFGDSQVPSTDLDRFSAAYGALIDKAWGVGAHVLACTVSPLGEQLSSPPNRQLASVNGTVKQVAAERGVPLADVWQAFVDELAVVPGPSRYVAGEWLYYWLDRQRVRTATPDEISRRRRLRLTFDGIHLNSHGADVWARTILVALARAQGTIPR
jgi:lysophospholipase L1-like esterase